MMDARSRLGLETLAAGLGLGVACDLLLRATPWGINMAVCTGLLVAAGVALVRRHRLSPGPDAPWLALTALLLGAAFVCRDAEALAAFDSIALLVTLALAAASFHGQRIAALQPLDYLLVNVVGFAHTVAGTFVLVGDDIKWKELAAPGRPNHLRAVILGVVLAVPLLLVFGSLFASADRVFGNLLANFVAFDVQSALSHAFLIGVFGLLAAGYLRWSLLGRMSAAAPPTTRLTLGIVPVATALGLLSLLFLAFVAVQLGFLFGGAALVERTTDLTYATYARSGFFELVWASALLLPVLLGADHLVRAEPPARVAVFHRIAGLLLVLLGVIIVSALQRMRLYVQAYGLSEDRLYATAFMILLTGIFGWLAVTILRGRRQRFAFGALIQGFVVLAGLHVMNPDAFIVRANLRRPAAERPFDARYAVSLGADAVPHLLAAWPTLDDDARCVVAAGLLERWAPDTPADWRNWNWSRGRARRLVAERADELRALACPKTSSE